MKRASWFRWWMIPAAVPVAAVGVCGLGLLAGGPCGGLFWQYGIVQFGDCPSGVIRGGARVQAWSVLRGSDEGEAAVTVAARWMAAGADATSEATAWRGTTARLELLDDAGELVEGFVASQTRRDRRHLFSLRLPADLPDGAYTLRATAGIAGEEVVAEAPLALYAPALAHVALDRPLYQPGNTVHLRSVLLRRTDQSPLEGRPGRWVITDPLGVEVHKERDEAGPWGIADTTFYLASDAPVGTWRATWRSADAEDTVSFEVRPFTLPRFTVDASATERWFHPGELAVIEGTARYTSGAPVQDAPIRVRLGVVEGRWPLPVAWEGELEATTDAQGRYRVELGTIPEEELLERELAALAATVIVTDETGETQAGGTRVIVSADDVRAEVLTELEGGLVGGFNNRAWVRVTTPDGVPVREAALSIGNPYDDGAKRYEAETDVDGVAMLQLDPGDPISVPQPPVPVRVRPRVAESVSLSAAAVLPGSTSPSLTERRSLDRALVALADCGDFVVNGAQVVESAVQVGADGSVRSVATGEAPVDRCVADTLRRVRFPAGEPRVLKLSWRVPDSLAPSFPSRIDGGIGATDDVRQAVEHALLDARTCVGADSGRRGATVLEGSWRVPDDSTTIRFDVRSPRGSGLTGGQLACVERALTRARLPEGRDGERLGGVRISLDRPGTPTAPTPKATFTTGYPVGVTASVDGEAIGETLAVVGVGAVPSLRVRMTPTLPAPGDEVTVDLLRGPDFYGELPQKIRLYQGSRELAVTRLPQDGPRSVTFTVPEDARGFLHVDVRDARGVVFVRDPEPLSVALSTDAATYAPGSEATLTVTTKAGDRGVPAAVGLIGVDQTLEQLATLLGPDDMGRVTVRAVADEPAFGAFDPRALALGRVRGDNASTAAVMRLTSLPMDAAGDQPASASATASVDDMEILTRRFWRAREALVDRVRDWEDAAPDDELLTHERMLALWGETLAALEADGVETHDAFDRPLTVDTLPGALVARLDPREIAADATRLPEDVTSWMAFVDQEVR